ncbi:MAG: hypothetical protein LBQ66_00170 [Planctomycetaceae bacterium]|jgi:hypothetical protein|nr:hypothetical protein [Planctomycetaceae bacterium]
MQRILVVHRRTIFYCLIAIVGLVVGWSFVMGISIERGVVMIPDEATFLSPVNEGDDVSVPLLVRNESSTPYTIDRFSTSCGCTSLITDNENTNLKSVVLLGYQTLLLQATMSTHGIDGDRSVDVWGSYQAKGKTKNFGCRINIHVLPALRQVTRPAGIIKYDDNTNPITRTIVIGDAFSDSGIEVDSVVSNTPEIVSCTLKNIPDEDVYERTDILPKWQRQFRKRYEVEYSFDRNNDSFETNLVVQPKDKKHRTLTIPVLYEGAQNKPKVFPSELLIPVLKEKTDYAVEVRIVSGRGRLVKDVVVSSLPDGFALVSKQKTKDVWSFQFVVDTLRAKSGELSISFEDENLQPFVTVPVSFVGKHAASSN